MIMVLSSLHALPVGFKCTCTVSVCVCMFEQTAHSTLAVNATILESGQSTVGFKQLSGLSLFQQFPPDIQWEREGEMEISPHRVLIIVPVNLYYTRTSPSSGNLMTFTSRNVVWIYGNKVSNFVSTQKSNRILTYWQNMRIRFFLFLLKILGLPND